MHTLSYRLFWLSLQKNNTMAREYKKTGGKNFKGKKASGEHNGRKPDFEKKSYVKKDEEGGFKENLARFLISKEILEEHLNYQGT